MKLPKIIIFLTYFIALLLLPLLLGAVVSTIEIIKIIDHFHIYPFLYALVPVFLFSLAISIILVIHHTKGTRKAHLLIHAILYPLSFASVVGVIAFGVLYLLSRYGSLFSGAGLAAGMIFIGMLASAFGIAFAITCIWGLTRWFSQNLSKESPNPLFVTISAAILLIIIFCLESLVLFSTGKNYYEQKSTDNLRATVTLDQKKIDALKNVSDSVYDKPCTNPDHIRVAHDVWSLVDKSLQEAGRPELVNLVSMKLRESYFGCSYSFEGEVREIDDQPFALYTLEEMIEMDTTRILKNYNHISKEDLPSFASPKNDSLPLDLEKLTALRDGEKRCSDDNIQIVYDIWGELERQLQKNDYAELPQVVTFIAEKNNPSTDGCIYTVYDLEGSKITGNGWPSREFLGNDSYASIVALQVETILGNMQHQKNDAKETLANSVLADNSRAEVAQAPLDQKKIQFLRDSYEKNGSFNTCSEEDLKFTHDIWVGVEDKLRESGDEKHISDDLFYISSSSTNKPEGCNLDVRSPLNQGVLTISFGTNVPRVADDPDLEQHIESSVEYILSD